MYNSYEQLLLFLFYEKNIVIEIIIITIIVYLKLTCIYLNENLYIVLQYYNIYSKYIL